MTFDELIRAGDDIGALRHFANEYYKSGKMGGTRKALLDRIADRLTPQPLKDVSDCPGTFADGACPNCRQLIERVLFGEQTQIGETGEWTDAAEYELKYCPNCGQRLEEIGNGTGKMA